TATATCGARPPWWRVTSCATAACGTASIGSSCRPERTEPGLRKRRVKIGASEVGRDLDRPDRRREGDPGDAEEPPLPDRGDLLARRGDGPAHRRQARHRQGLRLL